MKKIILVLFAIVGFITTVNAQQTLVLQNNQGSSQQTIDPNIYYIKGIPSTQDIGGVEALPDNKDKRDIVFTNYNVFTVTVLYEAEDYDGNVLVGSVVLRGGETKIIDAFSRWHVKQIATITRKLQ